MKFICKSIAVILAAISLLTDVLAASVIPPGQYFELYSGVKMGGPKYHHELYKELKADKALDGFEFFCISGRDRSASSSSPAYAIDREQRLLPVRAKICKGSAAILMGPVLGENLESLKKHLENNYMHLYMDFRTVR